MQLEISKWLTIKIVEYPESWMFCLFQSQLKIRQCSFNKQALDDKRSKFRIQIRNIREEAFNAKD